MPGARAIRIFRCRAICLRRAGIRPASSSATAPRSPRLLAEIAAAPQSVDAAPLIDGVAVAGRRRDVLSPIDGKVIGTVEEGDEAIVGAAMAAAQAGFASWSATPVDARAGILERAGDLIERNRGRLIALLAKRRRQDARRLRLRSARGRRLLPLLRGARRGGFSSTRPLPGPTGESNELRHRGRGVFVCISPWNFPLAIFTGQIVGALAAGNAVVAKPAEQTPLIASEAVKLLHAAGVPRERAASRPRRRQGRRHAHRPCRRSPASSSPARRKSPVSSTARSPPRTGRSRCSSPRPAASTP